jgi:hypothetical protein
MRNRGGRHQAGQRAAGARRLSDTIVTKFFADWGWEAEKPGTHGGESCQPLTEETYMTAAVAIPVAASALNLLWIVLIVLLILFLIQRVF